MYKEKWKLKRAVYTVHSHEVQTQQLNYAASQGSQTFFLNCTPTHLKL